MHPFATGALARQAEHRRLKRQFQRMMREIQRRPMVIDVEDPPEPPDLTVESSDHPPMRVRYRLKD